MIENSYYHPPLAPSPPITAEEAVVSELLEHGRPLTQRALRYLRQSVRRVGEDDFSDRLKSTQLTELGSILRKNGPADEYDLHAQMPITKRDFDDEANHPPFDSIYNPCTSRNFLSPLSHLQAPPRREMISMNTFKKKTPIAAPSTANPGSPSAFKTTYSATAPPAAPLLFRRASGPGIGRSRNPSPSLPHMRHCAHLWNKMDNTPKREMLRVSFQDVK